MKIKLTTEQKKHFKSFKWLFSGPRASGRTTLLAYAMIECVLEVGHPLRIVDHHPDRRSDMNLASIIDSIIKENNLPLKIDRAGLFLSRG